jgi:hypothetical protein
LKTLYIHGLDSHPVKEKLEILNKAGLEVFALHLDYRTEKNAYRILKKYVLDENISFLVGSSLGGYIAYWLAEELGLPCLLFNPAMSYSDAFQEFIPEIENRDCPARFVVVGAFDEIINPDESVRFFRKLAYDDCFQRLVVCDWLEHQIDYKTFEEMVHWALLSYRNFIRS